MSIFTPGENRSELKGGTLTSKKPTPLVTLLSTMLRQPFSVFVVCVGSTTQEISDAEKSMKIPLHALVSERL